MAVRLAALCIEATNPSALVGFWGGVLGWESVADHHPGAAAGTVTALVPDDDTGFRLRFVPTPRAKTGLNRMHFDLTSRSLQEQQDTVDRALGLGARHFDVGQTPEEEHVVLADPEDNEFCVIEPGNQFLAECGFVGAVSSDGSQEVGYFWSRALGWPLVWDQDQETAIRSPLGGSKITWAGPPVAPQTGEHRWHYDLAVPAIDLDSEVERLVSLGARTDASYGNDEGLVLGDPDGNPFCVLSL